MTESLNTESMDPAYLCGRLFSDFWIVSSTLPSAMSTPELLSGSMPVQAPRPLW